MRAIIQFCFLFAGPIGLVLLTGFVVTRWLGISLRRGCDPGEPPELRVLPGGRSDDPGAEP